MKKLLTLLLLLGVFNQFLLAQNGVSGLLLSNLPRPELCSGIATDSAGRIWLSFKENPLANKQNKSGLYMLGPDSILQNIRTDSLGGPLSNYMSDIQYINGRLYCGSSSGLLDLGNGNSCRQMRYPGVSSQTDSVNGFILSNNTWIMGTQGGLLIYNPTIETWQLFNTSNSSLPTNQINAVASDSYYIWLATDKGVIAFDPNSKKCKIYNQLNSEFESNLINSVACAPNGNVWAGGSGNTDQLGLYILKDGVFKNIESVTGYCQHRLLGKGQGNLSNYCSIGKLTLVGNQVYFAGTGGLQPADLKVNFIAEANENRINLTPISSSFIKKTPAYLSGSQNLFGQIKGNQITFINYATILSVNLNELKPDTSYENSLKRIKDNWKNELNDNNTDLKINNQTIPLNVLGDMFWDIWEERNLSVNTGKCNILSYASSLWMGGISDKNLYVAANTYRQSGMDFSAGPLKLNNQLSDSLTQKKFGRHWKVEERTLAEFIAKRGTPGYIIPEEILSWPAHGDTLNGYAKNLAPFIDLNQNGIYEPVLGDYPDIRGQQNVFWIYNDARLHSETEGNPLNIEVHANAYGYVCKDITDFDANKAVNNTSFYRFKIVNRSNRTYEGFKVGFWIDTELGYYADDYLGSNPQKEYLFWYNSDSSDMGPFGFGNRPPAAALVMLEGMKNPSGQNLKIGGVHAYENDFSVIGNPSRPEHFYYYLNNRWKDSLPVTYGGNGRNGMDSDQVFMFCGNNDPKGRSNWTEETAGNMGGDRRALINSQSVTLAPGEEQTLVFALVYTPGLNRLKPEVLADLDLDVEKVRHWYANDSFPSCSNIPLAIKHLNQANVNSSVKIYPNPTQNEINVEFSNNEPIDCVKIFDLNGKLIWIGTKNLDKPIDISYLETGLYFLQAITKKGSSVSRFIKN
jgi:hypothetical protein